MSDKNLKFFDNLGLLRTLAKNSLKAIDKGFYETDSEQDYSNHYTISLKNKIAECNHAPIITEIKLSSPSKGNLVNKENADIIQIAKIMESSGSIGISILAQPYLFEGSIKNIHKARKNTTLPIIMKDIIVSDVQIKAAKKSGADAILLIKTIFDKNLAEDSLDKLTDYAKKLGLEIIIETHYLEEFIEVISTNSRTNTNYTENKWSGIGKNTSRKFDIIGINNRNLDNLKIDLNITKNILSKVDKLDNIILSESGIYNKSDILFLKNSGADAFLVGSSLMENLDNLGKKIQDLYFAY